jgi:ABC-type antimicrobial peptide transport system permease subunit
VNEAFVNVFFHDENPIGKIFDRNQGPNVHFRSEIVGVVGNARYRNMREAVTPIAYVPLLTLDDKGVAQPRRFETFVVRTRISNPNILATVLRKEVTSARSEFHVTDMSTQVEINRAQTVRERLLATLAMFFAGVALTLAGIGLYGVLHYSVMQRRREIGIRIAVGAQARHVARLVTADVFFMIVGGSAAGIALSFAAAKYIASLLYEVHGTSPVSLAAPAMTILTAVTLAALPAIVQAMRIDPVEMLRPE